MMKHIAFPFLFVGAVQLLLSACQPSSQPPQTSVPIQIFAAAGTRQATDTICRHFEQNQHRAVSRNFASSGTLARQIASGAEADIFVSANRQWIDFLIDKGVLKKSSIHKIAGNSLVVIAPKGTSPTVPIFDTGFNIKQAIKDKIVIGDPAYVPVGKYTKSAFDKLGWFDQIKDKMVLTKDVSSALHIVAMGAVDWGVVYRSEAVASKKVDIIGTVPSALHNPIEFFVSDLVTQQSGASALSDKFRSKAGLAVFLKHGFVETQMAIID